MAEPTGDIWTFSRRASEEKPSDKHGNISAVYDVNSQLAEKQINLSEQLPPPCFILISFMT